MARPPYHKMRNARHSLPIRRSLRLQGYDYCSSGAYFVTICTVEKRPLFGTVRDGLVQLNEVGQIADSCWQAIEHIRGGITLESYIVMPNHVHGILLFHSEGAAGSLGAIIGQYKSVVTKRSRLLPSPSSSHIWQRNYYDHIIRSATSLEKIRQYIVENPARWADDDLYIG